MSPTTTRPTVRIFISSPGDVDEERDKARRVIDVLQRHYTGATLQSVLWQDLALPATATFQETIDLLLQRKPVDVAVFILWSRLGTPLGPPTVRPDGTPYLSGTEREFELMLAAFEQSKKQRPVILAYTREDESGFRQCLTDCPATGLEELITQRKLVDSFIRERFKDPAGHNIRAYHSYREPVSFAQRLHTHLYQVLDELLGAEAAPRWLDEPYRGLAVFDVEHAPIFQGRDEETCEVLQRLRDQDHAGCAFAVIVGASGSGKSSLARAGVAAALTQHAYDDRVKAWRVVTFFPGLGGSELNRSLTRALADQLPELRSSATALDDIANGLAKDASLTVKLNIEPAFARAAETAKEAVRILLLVDQMEELWTDRRITTEDRERFLDVLEALARSGHIAVLATLRSDFYPHAQCIPVFLRLKGNRGHCDLLPPGTAALHRLITEPARLAGLRFEREVQTGRTLDQLILQDASRDPAALPLLQYALSELYQQRDGTHRTLTFAAYQILGGVEGALGKRAAEVFQSLPPDVRAALPEILPLLVTVDIAGEQSAVRRRAPLAELTATPARRAVTESLIDARFLTTDRQDDTPIVSLAHEALLRRWDELAQWVTSNREHLRLRARTEQNQQRWAQQSEDPSLLLPSGVLLEESRILLREARQLLTAETVDYIERSIHHRQAESRRQRLIRTTALAMSLTAALIAIIAAIWINSERTAAVTAKDQETQAKNSERELRDLAERQQADANRQNADHFWSHAANMYDPFRASLLLLRGAQTLDKIPQKLVTNSDKSFLRSQLLAASNCDRDCIHTWLHAGPVMGAVLSRDASRVLTWGDEEVVRLQDVTKPETLQTFKHDGIVRGALFSRDETRVLTWSMDGTARLWEVSKTEPIQTFEHDRGAPGHRWHVDARFSQDESRVLTWSGDGTARLWDVTKPEELQTFKHNGEVIGAQFSRDDSRVLTWSRDHTARLWDVTKPEPIQTFKHDSVVYGAEFSQDEARVISWSTDEPARLWDVTKTEPIRTFEHTNDVRGARFSRDDSRVLTWSFDKTARLWDVTKPEPLQTFNHNGEVIGAEFNQDESLVLTWSQDGARLWDVTKPDAVRSVMLGTTVSGAQFSRDESQVLIWCGSFVDTGLACLWKVTESESSAMQEFQHDQNVVGAQFSGDESRVLTWSEDKTARLWDASEPKRLQTFEHKTAGTGARFSRDESRVLTWSEDETAKLWDVTKLDALQSFKHNGSVNGAEFSRDESRVLTWSGDTTARLWDVTSPEPIRAFKHEGSVNGARFSRDNSRVLTWSDGTVRLWDVSKPEALQTYKHDESVRGAEFSQDESRVLTWSDDTTARLWDVTRPEPVRAFKHEGSVNGARFSRGESRVLTWGDGTVRLWDVSKPEALQTYKHTEYVFGAEFSQDESIVLTWTQHWARLWDVTKPEPVLAFHVPDGLYVLSSAEFSRDGSRVLTSGGRARLWDARDPLEILTPVERTLELEVRSCQTLDANLQRRTMSFDEWQARLKSPEYRAVEKKLAERPKRQAFLKRIHESPVLPAPSLTPPLPPESAPAPLPPIPSS